MAPRRTVSSSVGLSPCSVVTCRRSTNSPRCLPRSTSAARLSCELEADALDVRAVLAPAGLVVDDDLLDGGGLVPAQRRDVDDGVARGGRLDIILHVGEADPGELGEDALLGDGELLDRPLGRLGLDGLKLRLQLANATHDLAMPVQARRGARDRRGLAVLVVNRRIRGRGIAGGGAPDHRLTERLVFEVRKSGHDVKLPFGAVLWFASMI